MKKAINPSLRATEGSEVISDLRLRSLSRARRLLRPYGTRNDKRGISVGLPPGLSTRSLRPIRVVDLAMTIFVVCFFSHVAFAGTVSGKINFTGAAPQNEQLSMGADPICSSLHSEPVFAETVLANPNNTLKNVFVYVKTGLEGKTFPASATPVTMDQRGCQYHPHVFGIQVGQPLEIINSDSTLHNVHSLAAQSKQFNLGMPIQGMKLQKKFEKPEVMVKMKCDVHPWMNAYVGVLEHPFYGVSGDEGTFEIKDLPAGTYVIEAWHEKYGTQMQDVTVGDGPTSIEFTFAG